jgi:acetolactate synthase I/II/III large subunit
MKRNGALLAVYALEQIGVRKTFGIPGIYNSELYDHLYKSTQIEPVIVCSELSAGYMADAVSRTTGTIGTIVIVQGAGITHAMSAIGQAYIDGIPLLIISGSNKLQGKDYQLHNLNLSRALDGLVKQSFQIKNVSDIIPTIFNAFELATGGEPGPVFIDIPLNIQAEQTDLDLIPYKKQESNSGIKNENSSFLQPFEEKESYESKIESAGNIIANAKQPGLFAGWGTIDAYNEVKQLAELLAIPVCTTLQGSSVFPYNHPLHTGIGFGPSAVPAARNAFKSCDCLIAVGVKFSELATSNFQLPVPENLIHIDINPEVFHKNYHAKVAIEGDSKIVLGELIKILTQKGALPKNNIGEISKSIQKDKEAYKKTWLSQLNEELVSPGFFFNALRNHFDKDTILISGNGSHRFYAAELFPVSEPRYFICPTDSNAMGYGIPACIATKLVFKTKTVIAIVDEVGFMINGLELITAQYYKLGIIVCVLKELKLDSNESIDKEKNLISANPVQKSINIEKFAASVHAEYFIMKNDIDISGVLAKSKAIIKAGKSVIVEVLWDSSRKSAYTSGLVKPDTSRISFFEKLKILFKSKE